MGAVPAARDSHSSCVICDKIYIYGGQGKGEEFFNDIYSLRIVERIGERFTAIWNRISVSSSI